jgi:ADP-ribose pyrophosphatase YjhB (NUDIX family)
MVTAMHSINNLDAAITTLNTFHEKHLIRPSQLSRPTLLSGHFFADVIRDLKSDEYLSAILATHELPCHLQERLMEGMQDYTNKLNQIFNRCFAHHPSLVLAVDPVSQGSSGILTHERQDPAKKTMTKAITGGGLVDVQETTLQAAHREFNEESGGCLLTACRLALVIDGVKSTRPYFMSCAYNAEFTGIPIPNFEAKKFEEIPYENLSEHLWFSDHATIVGDVLGLEEGSCVYPGSGIPYSSKSNSFSTHLASKPFKPTLRDSNALSHVEAAIERVVRIYSKLAEKLDDEFTSLVNQEALNHSCNEIGHGWENEIVPITTEVAALRNSWNDDKRLWDFMGPIKLAAIEISNLFGTFINTGEGGVVEMAPLYVSGDRVYLKDVDGKLALHKELLTQFRNFKDSLHHHASENGIKLKPTNLPTLTQLYEHPSCLYKEAIRSRVFGFVIDIKNEYGVPKNTYPYSLAAINALPKEAWESKHDYNIFKNTFSFLKNEISANPSAGLHFADSKKK